MEWPQNRVESGLKGLIKLAAFHILNGVGGLHKAKGLPIVAYHSIDDGGSPISMAPAVFERQLEYLRDRGYRCVSLSDAFQWMTSGKPLPDRSVILTFDDGFKSNYTTAFPLLKRYGFSATVFLVTGAMGKKVNWKKVSEIPALPMMSWDEADEMAEYGVDFQSHSVTHPFMTSLSANEAMDELAGSREEIEGRLGNKVDFFCYPYGDMDEKVRIAVKEAGYMAACSSVYGKVQPGDDPMALKRICVEHISGQEPALRMIFYKASLDGAADLYMTLRKRCKWLFSRPNLPAKI